MSTINLLFKSSNLRLSQKHISMAAKESIQHAKRYGFGKLLLNTEKVSIQSKAKGIWDRK